MEIGVIGCYGSYVVYYVEKGRELGKEFVIISFYFTVVFFV